MLSMPIQQMARCMVYHGGIGVTEDDDATMTQEDKALTNDFLLDESYREYRPDIADPVKRHTNTYIVRYRTADFVKTYLHLFTEYPGDFVNAALAVNAGYLTPEDETHAHINENGTDTGLGYVQTRWVDKGWFMFFVTLLNQIYWFTGATLGGIFGSYIHFNTKGLDFVMTAMFVVIFMEQWMKEKNHASAFVGIGVSLICLLVFGADDFIIPSMLAILGVLTLIRKPVEGGAQA